MIHKLKILPEYFNLVEKNKKRFELRRNDRKYQEDVSCFCLSMSTALILGVRLL